MYRIEIVSNKSVEEDITEGLEGKVEGILYTKFPLAYGRGSKGRRLGTSTWPETNFVLVSYIDDGELEAVRSVIRSLKEKFPREGIKLFALRAEEPFLD